MDSNKIISNITEIEAKDNTTVHDNHILDSILKNMTFDGEEQPLYNDKIGQFLFVFTHELEHIYRYYIRKKINGGKKTCIVK